MNQTAWRGDTGWYGVYPLTRTFTQSAGHLDHRRYRHQLDYGRR